ncbi:hypothetical protein BDY24DRAFT_381517 [Mrakia frigida]|uniref:diacylglycerol kinase n=1 Tax=Mrakia frigida TaxID=29902 RepID=UPI003FCC16F5
MPTRPFRTDLYLSLPLFLSSLLASNHHPLPPFLSLRLLSPSLKMSTTRRTTRLNGSAAAPFVPSTQTNGHANGSSSPSGSSTNEVRTKGKATVDGKKKTFWEEYEVPRKALHASIGFVVLALNKLDPPTLKPLIIFLSVGLVACLSVDALRLNVPACEKLFERAMGPMMRDEEKTKINGINWYLMGVIFVLSFYPRDVAVLSILILSWADTAASSFGRLCSAFRYNPRLPRRVFFGLIPFSSSKSLAGFLAAWATGFVVAVGYYGGGPGGGVSRGGHVDWRVLEWKRGVFVTGQMVGMVAAVTEALDVGSLDDNLTLPIVSGGLVWAFLAFSSSYL